MSPSLRSVLALVAAGLWASPSDAAIAVKNTNDSGPGSLREAILRANAAPGPETITFAISSTPPHTIAPTTPLPPITNAVAIEGSKKYEVVLSGSRAGGWPAVGLDLQGTGASVTWMVVNGWSDGIRLGGGGHHKLDRNRIGTDAAGLAAVPNTVGVFVTSSYNQIGVGGRNILSGNRAMNVAITQAMWNQVQGNYIGLGASGQSLAFNVVHDSIVIDGGGRNTITSNLITGDQGLLLSSQTSSNVIVANKFCMAADGTPALDASAWGIVLHYSGTSNNVIGSPVAGGENVIAHCRFGGIYVDDGTRGNSIRGNRIYGVGAAQNRMAIDLFPSIGSTPNDPQDLDSGGNDLQNKPTIVDALYNGVNAVSVVGLLQSQPFSSYVVDAYASPVDPRNGSCDTAFYLGSTSFTTDAGGQATFFLSSLVPVSYAQYVSATATALTGPSEGTGPGSTSEVSACRAVRHP